MAFASNYNEIFGIRVTVLPWTTRIPEKVYSVTLRHWTLVTIGLWPMSEESRAGEFYDYPSFLLEASFQATVQDQKTQTEQAVLLVRNPGRAICLDGGRQSIRQEVAAQKKLWSFAECPWNPSQKQLCTFMYEETA